MRPRMAAMRAVVGALALALALLWCPRAAASTPAQLYASTTVYLNGSTSNWCPAIECPPDTVFFGNHVCSYDETLWNLGQLIMIDPINLPAGIAVVTSVAVNLTGVFDCTISGQHMIDVLLGLQLSTVCHLEFVPTSDTCYCTSCGVTLTCQPVTFPLGLPGYSTNGQPNFVQVLTSDDGGPICLSSVSFVLTYTILEPSPTVLVPPNTLVSAITSGSRSNVTVKGLAFRLGDIFCMFGSQTSPGTALSFTSAVCSLPHSMPIANLSAPQEFPVSISMEGLMYGSTAPFSVYPDPVISGVTPDLGVAGGGDMVVLHGSGFLPGPILCCFGEFGISHGVANSSYTVLCRSVGSNSTNATVNITVSYNGLDYTLVSASAARFRFYVPPVVNNLLFPLIPLNEPGSDDDSIWNTGTILQYLGWVSAGIVIIVMICCCCLLIVVLFVLPSRRTPATDPSAYEAVPQLDNLPTIDPSELLMGVRVGKGSFAEVYRATWRGIDVAVKKLSIHNLNEEFFKDFEREAFLMETLRHPNVLLFIGACLSPPDICIITEYMPRGCLYKILHSSAEVSWARGKAFALDAARGMHYLHSCDPPILHRDLKSHNLLVDEYWRVKVCDFGLSRMLEQTLNTMTACGTPSWTAPEILRNQRYTEKADVYSFGVVLWEIAARRDPYPGMPPFHVVFAVGTQGIRPVLPKYLPTNWLRLITLCWSEIPEDRPSFSEVIGLLADLEETDRPIPRPSSSQPTTPKRGVACNFGARDSPLTPSTVASDTAAVGSYASSTIGHSFVNINDASSVNSSSPMEEDGAGIFLQQSNPPSRPPLRDPRSSS